MVFKIFFLERVCTSSRQGAAAEGAVVKCAAAVGWILAHMAGTAAGTAGRRPQAAERVPTEPTKKAPARVERPKGPSWLGRA